MTADDFQQLNENGKFRSFDEDDFSSDSSEDSIDQFDNLHKRNKHWQSDSREDQNGLQNPSNPSMIIAIWAPYGSTLEIPFEKEVKKQVKKGNSKQNDIDFLEEYNS